MTVSGLISILQQHDPAAVVVLRWDGDMDTLVLTCEELRQGAVQAVQLHRLPEASGWDPLALPPMKAVLVITQEFINLLAQLCKLRHPTW